MAALDQAWGMLQPIKANLVGAQASQEEGLEGEGGGWKECVVVVPRAGVEALLQASSSEVVQTVEELVELIVKELRQSGAAGSLVDTLDKHEIHLLAGACVVHVKQEPAVLVGALEAVQVDWLLDMQMRS